MFTASPINLTINCFRGAVASSLMLAAVACGSDGGGTTGSDAGEVPQFDGSNPSFDARAGQEPDLSFVDVPAGTYAVGSPVGEIGREDSDLYEHDVTLTKGFRMATTEVSQELFQSVMGYNPSYFDEMRPLCANCPVDQITWHMAADFTNTLSAEAGLDSCYTCTGASTAVVCQPVGSPYLCNGYRLPTEMEWEIAARGGTTASFPNGGNLVEGTEYQFTGVVTLDNGKTLGSFAWFRNSSGDVPHSVGGLEANDYGLYDVIGNVAEWCHDWRGDLSTADGNRTDPLGAESGESRVARGGTYNGGQPYLRLSNRNWYRPTEVFFILGIRVAQTKQD